MSSIDQSKPIVWTNLNGGSNMNDSDLDYKVTWVDCADYTQMIETYRLKGTDTVVRQSVHTLCRKGAEIGAAVAT